jgi:O-antigen/teichoic acid export membrane protein
MALLLAGPALLAMITLAPWVIHLLYAASFAPATDVLRWQVLGDILKVASWPMGFILLAMGRGGIFIATEFTWNATYLGAIALGIQEWGLVIAGVGFWFAYLVYFCLGVGCSPADRPQTRSAKFGVHAAFADRRWLDCLSCRAIGRYGLWGWAAGDAGGGCL